MINAHELTKLAPPSPSVLRETAVKVSLTGSRPCMLLSADTMREKMWGPLIWGWSTGAVCAKWYVLDVDVKQTMQMSSTRLKPAAQGSTVRCDYRVVYMQPPSKHGTQPQCVRHQRGSTGEI